MHALDSKLDSSLATLGKDFDGKLDNLNGRLDAKIGALGDASLIILDRKMKALGNKMNLKLS